VGGFADGSFWPIAPFPGLIEMAKAEGYAVGTGERAHRAHDRRADPTCAATSRSHIFD
jgi:hypothetical protein